MARALRFLVLIVPIQKPCALSRWSRMTDHFALRAGTEFAPQRESARTHILRITISSLLTMRCHRQNPRHRQASRGQALLCLATSRGFSNFNTSPASVRESVCDLAHRKSMRR